MDKEAAAAVLIDAGLKIHRTLGPGLLESIYEECLLLELQMRGVMTQRQLSLPIVYEGTTLATAFRLDLIVARSIVVEIKSVEKLTLLHEAQLLTYLKLAHCTLGFLLNFNVPLFKQGIRRLVLS